MDEQNQNTEQYDLNRPDVTHPSHDTDDVHFTWEASEYVSHHKPKTWFIAFGVGTLVLIVVMFLLLRDVLSVLLIIVMASAVLVYAVRQPHTLQYSIGDDGLLVGHKEYDYGQFRSFSLLRDGALFSVTLMPTQRFAPPLSIYFDDQDGQTIMELLSRHLPHEERELDFIDRITRKLRF